MPESQTGVICESLWKKMIGKPYSGKLNVRFDEGELEIGYGCDTVTLVNESARNSEHKQQPVATAPALYSTSIDLNSKGGTNNGGRSIHRDITGEMWVGG